MQSPSVSDIADAIGSTATNSMTGTMGAFTRAFQSADTGIAVAGGAVALAFLCWQFSAAIAKTAIGTALQHALIEFTVCLVYTIAVMNLPSIIGWFTNALASFGTAASGGALKGNVMANPSLIMSAGYALFAAHWKGFTDLDWMDMITRAPVIILVILSQFGFLASSAAVIKTVVVANAQIMVGAVLTPFLVIPITRQVGFYGMSMIIAASVEMAIKAVLIGVGYGVLSSLRLKPEADLQEIVTACGQIWAVTMICSDFGSMSKMVSSAKGGF